MHISDFTPSLCGIQTAGRISLYFCIMAFSREFWRGRGAGSYALFPFSVLFAAAAAGRRKLYAAGVFRAEKVGVPVVVVGNVVAGGGGKTPLIIALVLELQKRGFRPGVATRGFGGKFSGVLHLHSETSWRRCGDEPLLIFRRTGAPVCAAKNRVAAARALAERGCDIILCDDGLQHYALRRDLEVCAANAEFGIGNGWFLPAGPLRENVARMAACDWIVISGEGDFTFPNAVRAELRNGGFFAADMKTPKKSADFAGKRIAALAGIAEPRRFFNSLRAAGIAPHAEYPLADHGRMDERRFAALPADVVLMTEKDAVKYSAADSRICCMRLSADLPPPLVAAICALAAGDGAAVFSGGENRV